MLKDSNILKSLGISSISIDILLIGFLVSIILLIVFLVVMIIQIRKANNLDRRLKRFMTGKNVKNLETEIGSLFEECKLYRAEAEKNSRDIKDIYHTLKTTFQKCGIVKYDAFSQMGGQLSFCIALLDEKNNGFVLNSVYSTEGNYTYAKQIKAGISDVELGTEEEKALKIAMN